jgi:hypothetical protein
LFVALIAHVLWCQGASAASVNLLLQALSPSTAITVVAVGMAVTAVTATVLAPVRHAGRGGQPPPVTAGGHGPGTASAAGAAAVP